MENEAKFNDPGEVEVVSKSQLKRESHNIQNLGKRLVAMSPQQLSKIPLDEHILAALAFAQKIQNKRSALKRHYQFIGKLLRARDTKPIYAAIKLIDDDNHRQIKLFHQAEMWRDNIIANGIDSIEALLNQQAGANRQKLRQLWRNYSTAKTDDKKTRVARLIYQEVLQALATI